MENTVVNVVFAGLGGQGVLKASDILAMAAFSSGLDVKQSEIHGMAQRGGSVSSDVRFGPKVLSPMVPLKGADFLVVLEADQEDNNVYRLKEDGVKLVPALLLEDDDDEVEDLDYDDDTPLCRKNFNVGMIGALSAHLDIAEERWIEAIKANLPSKVHDLNIEVFKLGRDAAQA